MPNTLDADGLTVNSTLELVANLTAAFKDIYGSDVNVDANSPDGQLINILAQSIEDNLQLLVQVYNSFFIDSAFGVILDQRVAMSGITRKSGTYTLAYVDVTASTALTLPGQDVLVATPGATVFTGADTAGNPFQLQTSFVFSGAGTQTLLFVSTTLGQLQTTPNTIQTITTPTPGISGINNPSTANDVEGLPEETDPQLKIRRAESFYLQAVSPTDAIRAALLEIADISDAYVVENTTGGTVNGVLAHSIWVIVTGGTPAEIAQVIYAKKAPGCGMTGVQTYIVVRPQGNSFTAQWDTSSTQALSVRATLVPRIPGQTFDLVKDAGELADALIYKLGQSPNIGDVVLAMQVIEPNAVLTTVNVSKDGGATWEDIVSPNTSDKYFTVIEANITLT